MPKYAELSALLRATLPEFFGSLSAALVAMAGGWAVRRVKESRRQAQPSDLPGVEELPDPAARPGGGDAR